jgi:hypothetical protein
MAGTIVETQGGNCVVCGHWVESFALGDALCGAIVHSECLAEHVKGCVECQEIGESVSDTAASSARKPTLQELAVLCYSVDTLFEWLAYKKHAEQFYERATCVVVHINEDFDSDIGASYSVASVDVFDGETLVRPSLDLLNRYADDPFTESSDEDEIAEFLDDFVADLPVPFEFGNIHEQETVEIDLTRQPADAQLATRLCLTEGGHDVSAAPNVISTEIHLLVTGIGGPFDTPQAFRTLQEANEALSNYAEELDLEPDEAGEHDFSESEHNAAIFTLNMRTLQVQ